MTDSNDKRATRETDDLGQRIKAQIQELREKGELSDAHLAYLTDAESKRVLIEKKIAAATREGRTLDALKEEAIRDYRGIFEDLNKFVERLDTDLMKAKGR